MRKHLYPSLENEQLIIPTTPYVFLGGTCNNSTWREELKQYTKVPMFNPIVSNWTEEAIDIEEEAKKQANVLLYVITPELQGLYSIAELSVSACLDVNKKVVIVFLDNDNSKFFNKGEMKSIEAIKLLLKNNTNAIILDSLKEVADYLNKELSTS